MNETDVIRQQLALERAHLREILEAVRHAATPATARAVSHYIDFSSERLLPQLRAQHDALATAADLAPARVAELSRLSGAAVKLSDTAAALPISRRAELLLSLLAAWSEPLDELAARTLRVTHWRRTAQLSADCILEERQLYAAARAAADLRP